MLRGAHLVAGGGKVEARGILGTKREIKELRERVADERAALERLANETAQFEQTIAHASAAIAALSAELHRQEKGIVAVEGQLQRSTEDASRLAQRAELVAVGDGARARRNRRARRATGGGPRIHRTAGRREARRRNRARDAQRKLSAARDTAEALSQRAAEARASHAALVERSAAVAADVERLERAAQELERRVETCKTDFTLMRDQRERLLRAVAEGQRLHGRRCERARRLARRYACGRREGGRSSRRAAEQQDDVIRDARRALDAIRALARRARRDARDRRIRPDPPCTAVLRCGATFRSTTCASKWNEMEAAGDIEPDVRAIRAAEAPDADELDESRSTTDVDSRR